MNWTTLFGIAVVIMVALGVTFMCFSGAAGVITGDYREFWQNMGTKDIGEASTFTQANCDKFEGETCFIISGHWENINAEHMTGTYVLRCRCYKQEGS